jgi:hypothetical protein
MFEGLMQPEEDEQGIAKKCAARAQILRDLLLKRMKGEAEPGSCKEAVSAKPLMGRV